MDKHLAWRDLTVELVQSKKSRRTVVDSAMGTAYGGRVLAMLVQSHWW